MPIRHALATRVATLAVALAGSACATNPWAPAPPAPPAAAEKELTAGLVQREVKEGSTADEVASALGSPNVVTRGADGREVWIYDRIASERVSTVDSVTVVAAGSVAGAMAGGFVGAGGQSRRATDRTSQRTLTVIIRFDESSRVASVSVHSTRF